MIAAQYVASGQIELVDVPIPTRASGQVLVSMSKVAICGSDIHVLRDSPVATYPLQPGVSGHECVGVVRESDSSEFSDGDWVLVVPPESDAYTECLVVEPRWLIPLPEGLDPELGLMAQLLGTVLFCCRKLGNVLDKVVVVSGQGPAGLLFTALLYHMGARQVIGLDVVDHRLTVARQLGADYVVNVLRSDPLEVVRDITADRMADLVIEAAGEVESINSCVDLARPGGELALFGVPRRRVIPFRYESLLRRQVRTIASVNAPAEPELRSFRLALDLIATGRIDVAPLITHRLPFSEVRRAFWLAETKQDGAVKVLLDLSASS